MPMRLFRKLMPREGRFVEHFVAHVDRMVAASDALLAMMEAAPAEREERFRRLCAIEGEADAVTRETIIELHRAFITPFDRSDIHALINSMDDAVDLMEEVGQDAALYQVKEYSRRMREFAVMIQEAARLLATIIPMLNNISRNAERIIATCDEVGKIEGRADRLLRDALADLIAEKPELIDFLGRKEVYEKLEAVTDRCADVADVIEGIVLDQV
jgi:predicted phosphate transport protein (TIGR00153 family)